LKKRTRTGVAENPVVDNGVEDVVLAANRIKTESVFDPEA
jgi:hypothetical protein